MIQSICIQYRRVGSSEWKLYKYVSVTTGIDGESGTSEILSLRKAFDEFFIFRVVIMVTEPVTLMLYNKEEKEWRER